MPMTDVLIIETSGSGGQHLAAPSGTSAVLAASNTCASATSEAEPHELEPIRRLQVFSDLHIDVGRSSSQVMVIPPAAEGVDCVVVAGDTCEGISKGLMALRNAIPSPTPIVTVAGNHEFYRGRWPEEIESGRGSAADLGISFLEDEVAVVAGIRFVGATLWTDYDLFGTPFREVAMRAAAGGLNDHRLITWAKKPWLRFRPQEARALHLGSIGFIERTLATPFDGPSVVVSHHAPHPASIDPRYQDSALNPAYASDLTDLIRQYQPDLWIHGHVHRSAEYWIGRTRVVCNPRGYGGENPEFDPALVVDVSHGR
jgi:predicted phosphodiesterase